MEASYALISKFWEMNPGGSNVTSPWSTSGRSLKSKSIFGLCSDGWKIEQNKFGRKENNLKENNLKENKEEMIFFFGKKGKTKGRYNVTLVSGGTLQ